MTRNDTARSRDYVELGEARDIQETVQARIVTLLSE
jgi:hypothetical protein